MNAPLVTVEILLVVFIFTLELDLAVDRVLAVRLGHNDAQRKWRVLDRRRKVGLVSGDHTFLQSGEKPKLAMILIASSLRGALTI